jgi:glutathione S-transferase
MSGITPSEPLRLISIGPSHFCEKARWALERAYIAFTEDKHAPGPHISSTRGMPGGTSCPKLVVGKGSARVVVGKGSSEILEYADKKITKEEDRLYPSDPEQRQLVKSWEAKFDNQLGIHVRRYAYSYLLFVPSTYKMLTQGSSTIEKVVVWFLMPLLRRVVYRGLGCDKPGNKEKSLQVIESMFKEVDDVLADGRPYICGSKFTAADLTFAALGGPMVAPPQSGTWSVPLNECPSELATTMRRLQVTPAGQFILKTYETKRRGPEEKKVY